MTEEVLDRAEAALKANDLAGAERALAQAWPDSARAPGDAQHLLAMIRLGQQRPAEAAALLRSAVRAEPQSLRHRIALGHVLMATNDFAAAADSYAEGLRIDANWPGLLLVYADAAQRAGRHGEAETAARRLTAENPSAEAWVVLSTVLAAQRKAEEALAAADRALAADAAHVEAHNRRGVALLMLNRPQEALEAFDRLVARGVEAPALAVHRGDALRMAGREKDAQAVWASAAQRWPNLPNLQSQIAARRR